MRRSLYLEERVHYLRRALDERTVEFMRLLPAEEQDVFRQFVMDCISICHGEKDAAFRMFHKVKP
jgi:hypothetical protein